MEVHVLLLRCALLDDHAREPAGEAQLFPERFELSGARDSSAQRRVAATVQRELGDEAARGSRAGDRRQHLKVRRLARLDRLQEIELGIDRGLRRQLLLSLEDPGVQILFFEERRGESKSEGGENEEDGRDQPARQRERTGNTVWPRVGLFRRIEAQHRVSVRRLSLLFEALGHRGHGDSRRHFDPTAPDRAAEIALDELGKPRESRAASDENQLRRRPVAAP